MPLEGPILVQLPSWLGDAVVATGLLASLGRAAPGRALDVLGNRVSLAVAARHPAVRAAHDDGRERGNRLGAALARRHPPYAATVTLGPSWTAAVLARLIGAPVRVGFAGAGRRALLTHRVVRGPRGARHLGDEYLALARAVGFDVEPSLPSVVVDPAARDAIHARLGPGAYLVLAPGAIYGPAKRWSVEGFTAVGRELLARHGWRVVVIGGAGDRPQAAAVAAAIGVGAHDLCGATTIAELAALLAGARLVIANDSGPMHLAAAVGAPVIGLFGSTEPAWTRPLGGTALTVEPRPPCAPCFRRTCEIGYVCLTELAPARVLQEAARLLEARPAAAGAAGQSLAGAAPPATDAAARPPEVT